VIGRRATEAQLGQGSVGNGGVGDGVACREHAEREPSELQRRELVPHGWGHDRGAGWRVAGARPGVNVNLLASTELGDIEPLAGMTLLDGIPVRIEPADRPVPA
jgi:formate dehydrogenase